MDPSKANRLWAEYESAPLPVLAVDTHERLVFANALFEEFSGWPTCELVGLEAPFPFWPADRTQLQLDALLRGDLARLRVETISMQLLHRDGHPLEVLVTTRPLGDPCHPRAWVLFLHASESARAVGFCEATWLHARIQRLEEALSSVQSALDSSALSPPRGDALASKTADRDPQASLREMPYGLSRREIEVLAIFRRTDETRQIGRRLFISDHTVRNHLKSIYRKLGVRSKTQLMRRLTSDLESFLPPLPRA